MAAEQAGRLRQKYSASDREDTLSGGDAQTRESEEMTFQVGDRVEFIDHNYKSLYGKTATVTGVDQNVSVNWDGGDGYNSAGWWHKRFKKVEGEMDIQVGDRVVFRWAGVDQKLYKVLATFEYNDTNYVVLDAPITGKPAVRKADQVKLVPLKWEVGKYYRPRGFPNVSVQECVAITSDGSAVLAWKPRDDAPYLSRVAGAGERENLYVEVENS